MAVAIPPPLVPLAGASDREGRSRRNRHHWIAPRRGIIPIVLLLIIAAPQGFNIVPFQFKLLYGNAKPIQADDGSGRGPARGLLRWAKVSVGSGDRRCRASSARVPRGPSPSTSLGVLGLTRARQSILARQQGRLARRRQKSDRGRYCGARAPHIPPSIFYACARARDTQGGVASMAAREADGWQEQQREGVFVGCVRRGTATARAAATARPDERSRASTTASTGGFKGGVDRTWRRVGQRATTGGGRGERELR